MTDYTDIRRALAKATPGPWKASPYRGATGSQVWAGEPGPDAVMICADGDASDEDAALIVLLRNNAEALLADAERWRMIAEPSDAVVEVVARTLLGFKFAEGGKYEMVWKQFREDYMDEARAALFALRNLTPDTTGETR